MIHTDWVISQEEARKVCEVVLLVLPIFLISFVLTDRDKMASDTEDGIDDDTRRFRAIFEYGLSVVFIICFVVGMMLSVVGLVFTIYKPLLLVIIDCFGVCLAFMTIGALDAASHRAGRVAGMPSGKLAPMLEWLDVWVSVTGLLMVISFTFDYLLEATVQR